MDTSKYFICISKSQPLACNSGMVVDQCVEVEVDVTGRCWLAVEGMGIGWVRVGGIESVCIGCPCLS